MAQADITAALRTRLLEDDQLVDLLASSEGVFADFLPQNETLPAIRYEVLNDRREDALDGEAQLRIARVQYDCLSASRATADLIGRHVERILGGSTLAGLRIPETRDAKSPLVEVDDCTADNSYARHDPPRPGASEPTRRRTIDFEVHYLHDAIPAAS